MIQISREIAFTFFIGTETNYVALLRGLTNYSAEAVDAWTPKNCNETVVAVTTLF